jgi:hypothetical protein
MSAFEILLLVLVVSLFVVQHKHSQCIEKLRQLVIFDAHEIETIKDRLNP